MTLEALTDAQIKILRIAFKCAGRHGDAALCAAALRGGPAGRRALEMLAPIAAPILALAACIEVVA